MANYGFRVRDENGMVTLDTGDRLGRLIGSFYIPSVGNNQSISNNVFVGNIEIYGNPFVFSAPGLFYAGQYTYEVWYESSSVHYRIITSEEASLNFPTIVFYGVM